MDLVSGIVVYVCIWWLVFYMSLPFCVRPLDTPIVGVEKGAPQKTYIGWKILITTVITALLWLMIDYVITRADVCYFD